MFCYLWRSRRHYSQGHVARNERTWILQWPQLSRSISSIETWIMHWGCSCSFMYSPIRIYRFCNVFAILGLPSSDILERKNLLSALYKVLWYCWGCSSRYCTRCFNWLRALGVPN
uniref:Uncharacterized protein n=1 Tax=Opuntia streptacantha TaxID=393608 RepID=A0A7C8YES9_OPUST